MSTTADDTSSSGGSSSGGGIACSFDSSPGGGESGDRVEERFRVDRRKLESLMVTPAAAGSCDGEPVARSCPLETFFSEIELQTGAHIIWPSKLKVGAKSKRDPQVKITGSPTAVQLAKTMVLSHCSRKFSKLTLRIDVPHTEHGQLIGRHGALQKEIKANTGTDIHFPDSNKSAAASATAAATGCTAGMGAAAAAKNNQVSLNGLAGPQPAGMEKARRMIRAKQPLTVLLLLPPPVPDPSGHDFVQKICDTCKVCVTRQSQQNLHCYQQPHDWGSGWAVRGLAENAEGIAVAVERLSLYGAHLLRLAGSPQQSQQNKLQPLLVSCRFDFERRHAAVVQERLQLSLQTPPTSPSASGEENFFKAALKQFGVRQFDLTDTGAIMWEAGGCRALLRLRSCLQACLPAFLCFDMPCNAFAVEDSLIESLKGRSIEGVAVDFAIRRGVGGGGGGAIARAVTLRTHEGNVHAMYQLLNRIFATPTPEALPALMARPPLPQFVAPVLATAAQVFAPSTALLLASPPFVAQPQHSVPSLPSPSALAAVPPGPSTTSSQQPQQQQQQQKPLSHDSRAPGAEYSRKKLEAQRIMSHRPSGERFPTGQWSGLFFSRSWAPSLAATASHSEDSASTSAVPDAPALPSPASQSTATLQQPNSSSAAAFAQSCYYQQLSATAASQVGLPSTAAAARSASPAGEDDDEEGVDALLRLLGKHNLVDCAEAMISQEIDLCAFRKLSEDDLRSLGFNYATRQKVQQLIHSIAASPLAP